MMASNSPASDLVSIILITYNRAHLIGESIRSVIDQTYSNWELIIVDDGSSDHTQEIVTKYHDNRIQYYLIKHTGLLGVARNYGIRKALGEYIAFQDSDDLWRSDKLEFQIKLLKKHPDSYFVLSNNNQFGENAIPTPDYQTLFVGNLFLPVLEQKRFHFCGTSLIFRKQVVNKIGLLEETIPMMRELHFFFRMSREFKGIFTNERLVNVRRHACNTSNNYNVNAYSNNLKILKEFLNNGAISKTQFKKLTGIIYYKIGLFYTQQNQPAEALVSFLKYISTNPWQYKGWIRLFQISLQSLTVFQNKNKR